MKGQSSFTRVFNGVVYSYDAYAGISTRKEARKRAAERRRRGYRARVVQTRRGYLVFYR